MSRYKINHLPLSITQQKANYRLLNVIEVLTKYAAISLQIICIIEIVFGYHVRKMNVVFETISH